MTDNDIIKALECCNVRECEKCVRRKKGHNEELYCRLVLIKDAISIITRQKAEIERLEKFKSYFDKLYGEGLEVVNWHLNGDLEPFDNFYESALDV